METMMIRIRREDYLKLKKIFPSWKGETAASYFFRLVKFIEEKK